MKAALRSIRIAPKKANLVAGMVRGKTVDDALAVLERTNKKAARVLAALIRSAAANAKHNDSQEQQTLVIRSLIVNKAQAYHRGVPMARGRVRPMRKFLSHISVTLGVEGQERQVKEEKEEKDKKEEKGKKDASQTATKTVKRTSSPSSDGTSKKGTPAAKAKSAKAKGTAPSNSASPRASSSDKKSTKVKESSSPST